MVKSIPAKHGIPAVSYALKERDRIKIDKKKSKEMGLPEKGPIFGKLKEEGSASFKGRIITLDELSIVEPGRKIVYSGDTLPSKNIEKLAKNADILIHDATFFEELEERDIKHANVDQVIELAKEANVKQLILTHVSRRYQDIHELEQKVASYKDINVKLAFDFMRVVI